MASLEPERDREPGGIFIRYATVHDVDEVKSQLNRQDVRMDNQDAKIDTVIADVADIKSRQNVQDVKIDTIIVDVAEIKARQDAQEAKTDRHHAHMYRLLYTLLAAAVIALLMFAREAFF